MHGESDSKKSEVFKACRNEVKFSFTKKGSANYPVKLLFRAIKLGESAYYEWVKRPELNKAKTWVLLGKTDKGNQCGVSLFRSVKPFRFRLTEGNPHLRGGDRKTITLRY